MPAVLFSPMDDVRLRAVDDLAAALDRLVDVTVADETLALTALELALAKRLARIAHAGAGDLDRHVAVAVRNVDACAAMELAKL